MKRCPHCNRVEADDTLAFCRTDGVALINDPRSLGGDTDTAKFGSSQMSSEIETSLLPHTSTTPKIIRNTGPTTSLHAPQTQATTRDLVKPKRRAFGLAAAGVALVIIFALGYFYWSGSRTTTIESIAVLPFKNKSVDPNTEYLSDGLVESLIYRMSQVPNLKVSPTSSVIRYKGKDVDVAKIASELGVDAVMTGRLAQIGESLTISVELVDARNNRLLWGEQYDRKMSDLLVTQREIASEIVRKLQLRLSGEGEKALTRRYTDNNDAYQLYLKGRFHFAKRNRPDVERSVEYFKQAIALDPNFALAYSALANSYNGMTAYPYMAPKDAVPLAKAAANRALEIDPTLAEAHTALANSLACFDWNWKEAEQEFRRAVELNPNDAGTHWRYGMFYLMPVGRLEEAIAEGKRSLELEPLDLNHGANLSGLYFYAGRYDEALEQARQVHGLDSNFIVGRWALSQVYIQKGMFAEAIELNEKALQTEPTNPVFLRFAGIAYAKAGRRQEAEKIIDRFREIAKTQYVMSYHLALIYSALGDKDKAIAELENAFNEHDYLLPRIKVEPFLDPLRTDRRFQELIKRMQFP
jgi:adenylate cyclase